MKTKILLLGIGGGGCNGVRHLARYMAETGTANISSVLVSANWSDIERELPQCIDSAIGIGERVGKRTGASAMPEVGYRCAMEDREILESLFRDAGLVFLRICLGGGTGSGAGLAVAEMAAAAGNAAVVGLLTTPFGFEGRKRFETAEKYRRLLEDKMALTVYRSNEILRKITRKDETINSMFERMERDFWQVIRGISLKYAEYGRDAARLRKFLVLDSF